MNDTDRTVLGEFGRRVARLREARSWTPGQLAERAGIKTSLLEQIERGAVSTKLEHLRQLAGAFGIQLSELVDFDDRGRPRSEGFRHAQIVGNVVRVLGNLVADTPCVVLSPGLAVASSGFLWPDVMIVGSVPERIEEPSWLVRDPVVLVEVMTTASEQLDRDKFSSYRAIASLVDYVMVHADTEVVDHYQRIEGGDRWQLGTYRAGHQVQLGAVAGVFAVDDIYRRASWETNDG